MAGPTVTKNFTPAIVGINQPSVLTITISNPNASAITGAGFTDTYPANMVNSASPGGATSCTGGAVTAANNGTSMVLAGATIPASGSCTVTVNVVGTAAGVLTNPASPISVTSGNAPASVGPAATATLTVLAAPTVAKAFGTNPINPGANSVMTITLTNSNTTPISGGAFVDTYPSGLVNAAAPAAATTCVGGTATAAGGGNSVSLTGGTIPASGSCTVTVTVTAASGGSYLNNTGPVTTNNAGTGAAGTATLNVNIANGALALAKSFAPASIAAGGTSTLTITITNPNAVAVTGTTFTDTYPANLVNTGAAAVLNCGLAATQSAAGVNPGTLTLTNQTIPAGSTCTITIAVKGATALTQGSFNNCVPAFTPGNAPASAQACGILNIGSAAVPPPTISKAFSPNPIGPGGNSTLTFTITNVSTSGATVLNFNDAYPAGLTNTNPDATTNTCGGTLTGPGGAGAPDGNTGISLPAATPGTLAASSSCTVTTQVTAASSGAYNNTSGAVAATINAAVRTGNTASAALTVSTPASIAKTFAPSTINVGGAVSMGFTVTNPTAVSMTGATAASFSDALTNMQLANGTVFGTCAGVASNAAGGVTTFTVTAATIPATSSCTIIVNVTSSTPGGLPNASSGVTSNGVTGAPSNTATLTVTAGAPSITKSFSPATITSGSNTTMTLTISKPHPVALTGMAFTDGMTNMTLATTPAVGGTCTGVTTTSAGGATSFTVTAGTIPASGSCTVTVQVTSNIVGTWPNQTSGVTTTQTPTAGSASNTASLTVLTNGVSVSGTVYNDINNNGTLDGSPLESWTGGTSVFVNLVSGGAVVQSIAVGPGSGGYSFSNVTVGNYTIVLTNTATSTVAAVPTGWTFTGPTNGTIGTAVGTTGSLGLNFGLRQGQRIAGQVFRDTGVLGSPTLANNGIIDTNEAAANPQNPALLALGFGGVTVNLYANATCTGAPAATTTTDAGGNYVFASSASAGAVCIQKVNPTGYVATGASAGPTALTAAGVNLPPVTSYCRPDQACTPRDAVVFNAAANTSYANINFGVVPNNTFVASQAQQGAAGTTVDYAHTFVAGSVGTVTFSLSRVTTPAAPAWNEVLYRDNNCNGVLDAGDPIISGAISLDPNDTTAGEPSQRRVCIIVHEFIPAGAAAGAVNAVTVSAAFTYSNAAPALASTLTVIDTTTVGAAGLRLQKQVCNVTAQIALAAPCDPTLTGATAGRGFGASNTGGSGDELMYRIIYSNGASTPLTSLVVDDTTPAFTVRAATAAQSFSIPAGLTGPGFVQPAAGQSGAIKWTFGGSLGAAQQGVVTFNVIIQ